FVRITGKPDIVDMLFRQIPHELFEQVKDIEFNIDLLYQYPSKFIGGMNTRFYVLVDEDDKIKGVLWAFINILMETIQVKVLSIDKEYQNGEALEATLDFIKSWQADNENLKIQCVTKRPNAYRRAGWKDSKSVILEI
ncbi:hypothetical protein LCGC14_3145210, partial [marine sediment metagenome]